MADWKKSAYALRRSVDDLEPDHDQHANRYCYRCGAIFIRAGGVGTIRQQRNFQLRRLARRAEECHRNRLRGNQQ